MVKNNMYNLRSTTGLSQQKFADALGVSKRAIQLWESQKQQPSAEALLLITDYLKCDLRDVVYLTEEE